LIAEVFKIVVPSHSIRWYFESEIPLVICSICITYYTM
jgi:hypothetical protein